MSDEMNFTTELYTLIDEEGNEQTFEMMDALEQDGEKYYALIPYYENPDELVEDDGELVILKVQDDNGEELLVSIDDDEEFDKIGEIFLKRLEEMFDEEDESEGGCDCGHCN
jgi:uncharacterized protein YrzB (UPF0473 family)